MAKVWIGVTSSDAVGLRLDVRADVLVNGQIPATGQLANVPAGGSGFPNALLQSIGLGALVTVVFVNSAAPCPARPFTPLGTWTATLP